MIQKNWNSTFEWEVASGLARAYLNLGLILSTYVFLDTFDASQNVLHVSCYLTRKLDWGALSSE